LAQAMVATPRAAVFALARVAMTSHVIVV